MTIFDKPDKNIPRIIEDRKDWTTEGFTYDEATQTLIIHEPSYSIESDTLDEFEYSIVSMIVIGKPIRKVIIPATIRRIEKNAFADLEYLEDVLFEGGIDSVQNIHPEAFSGTPYEKSVVFKRYLATHRYVDIEKEKNEKEAYQVPDPDTLSVDSYYQFVGAPVQTEGVYKKQRGGQGWYGKVCIVFSPQQDSLEPVFVNGLEPKTIPDRFLEDIEKGVRSACMEGINGCPIYGVKAFLFNANYHPVDSHKEDFYEAAKIAFNLAKKDMELVKKR